MQDFSHHQQLYIPHGSDESHCPTSARTHHLTLYPTWFRWKSLLHFNENPSFDFISHMVQMKASLADYITFPDSLYIPHGSDERKLNQWRLKILTNFISHMVQMKGLQSPCNPILKVLYIPHGSDESLPRGALLNTDYSFISHMVQMKGLFVPLWVEMILLYIPHGSDERTICAIMSWNDPSLYPTWFRWKAKAIRSSQYSSPFISHMVQMKDNICHNPSVEP